MKNNVHNNNQKIENPFDESEKTITKKSSNLSEEPRSTIDYQEEIQESLTSK